MSDDMVRAPETNAEWVAMELNLNYSRSELAHLKRTLEKLNMTLYKEWARDMSLRELLAIVDDM